MLAVFHYLRVAGGLQSKEILTKCLYFKKHAKMRNAWYYYLKRFFNTQDFTTCKNSQLKKPRIHKRRVQAIGGNFKTQNGNVKDA